MDRIAAIDYGTVRIGLAMSDPRQIIAQPLDVLKTARNHQLTSSLIQDRLKPFYPIETILIGLPMHLNGKESPMSLVVREFAKILECTLNISIVLCDERLTTAFTERCLKEGGVSRKKRKDLIDSLTATVILQTYLDKLKNT
ncbi:MAG: Holliday junction resolvase RuvX [Rhabdochlamydiaceae bacterium]